jgi:hypothetical protein
MSKLIAVFILSSIFAACAQMAEQSTSGLAPEAKDMALVGFNDLQSRSAISRLFTGNAIVSSPTSVITAVRH